MQLLSGLSDFVLQHNQAFGKDDTKTTLYFRKAAAVDLYFFNRFELEVNFCNQTSPLKQTFYISAQADHITLKEGYNLLSGRAVQKEHRPRVGEVYKVWLQLDFNEKDDKGQYKFKLFHPNYGFDLEAVLQKHPIQEMKTVEGNLRLMESLARGNQQLVTYGEPGREQKVFVEASPRFKSVQFLDISLRRLGAGFLDPSTASEPVLPFSLEGRENPIIPLKKKSPEMYSIIKEEPSAQEQNRKMG